MEKSVPILLLSKCDFMHMIQAITVTGGSFLRWEEVLIIDKNWSP